MLKKELCAVLLHVQVMANIESMEFNVVDARSEGRFRGTAPEPRPGLRGGHIPGSFNVPFPSVLTAEGFLKPDDDLLAVMKGAGMLSDTKAIVSTPDINFTYRYPNACICMNDAMSSFRLLPVELA